MSMCVSDWTAFSTQTVRTFTVKNGCICSPASCFDSLHYIMTLECDESSECEYFTQAYLLSIFVGQSLTA